MSAGGGKVEWDQVRSYHGQAVIKEPVWSWEIPCYFFTGGMAGASAGLAYMAELRGAELLARRAWGVSLASISVSPALLTLDLGKPLRFLNMLRMFKVTSPMSVGSWILTTSGASTAVAAANSWLGLFPRSARIARPLAALAGLPLSTYTAALISNTAVPLWHESRALLPYVFGSGAALTAGAAVLAVTPLEEARPARRLALGAAICEGPLMEYMASRLGELGEPYKHGTPAKLAMASRVCIVSGTALLYRRGGSSRIAAAASSALLLAGALATRWSVFKAGFVSAANPKYVVGPQRERIARGTSDGAARLKPAVSSVHEELASPATASTTP